jgi:hypothetical protein
MSGDVKGALTLAETEQDPMKKAKMLVGIAEGVLQRIAPPTKK